MSIKRYILTMAILLAHGLCAEVVHVYTERSVSGVVTALSDKAQETDQEYVTDSAPQVDGYIFTQWTSSDPQGFTQRDIFGRAHNAAIYRPYQSITLTANYLPENQDEDGDGIADGWEIYWYGDLLKDGSVDSDGDGYTFAQELTAGTDPLMPDRSILGGIDWRDSNVELYNPHGYEPLTIRCAPEGTLLETKIEYHSPGTTVSGPTASHISSTFAYWTTNGVRVADAFGRAVDTVVFTMPNAALELVAVCESDENRREKLYWYGRDVSVDSDTDGDGYTFAQELAAGTDPLMPDRSILGGIDWRDSNKCEYNPFGYCAYVIRSEPEGVLFATQSDTVSPGATITTPPVSKDSGFAYWVLNGVRMADVFGCALDKVTVSAPKNERLEFVAVVENDVALREKMYWYGTADIADDSDTDGDGFTYSQELAAGTNPLMPDRSILGGIDWRDSNQVELNLQPYEQVQGAVVEGSFEQLFTSPVAGNGAISATFGDSSQIWPVVADVNGDGKWDIVVCWEKESGGVKSLEFRVYLNVGSSGNPEFVEGKNVSIPSSVDLAMNSTDKLAALTLDVESINALSATTNGATLLVSDTEGRIWFYEGSGVSNSSTPSLLHSLTYTLQHKVWGGSHAGFANGLRLAAVDWEDDGDLDCICGTAEGKLMLLRNPKVGRPTNLKALAGVDNVLLTWDPNAQSRVRGYRVYRAAAETTETTEGTETTGAFNRIAEPPLPTYRDFPSSMGSFDYKVSSVSRFYTAGNSTPTVTESPATEAVRATLGTVKFFWNDVVCKLGENANVMLSIENSLNYNVAGTTQTVTYDPEYLRPLKVAPTGLTEGFNLVGRVVPNAPEEGVAQWEITIESGDTGRETLPAGGGKFFTLVFETLKEGVTTVGGSLGTTSPTSGATVTITARSSSAPYQLGDVTGDGVVDVKDLRELAKLKNGNGRKSTANQLKAGDFNGNGKLDNADYQSLRELLKEKGLL